MNLRTLILATMLMCCTYTSDAQSIEKVVFSSVASNSDDFETIAGTPYGEALDGGTGSLNVSAYYGGNTIDVVTSIREETMGSGIMLYPNPTSNFVNIGIPDGQFPVTLKVFDGLGKIVLMAELKEQSNPLDLSQLATGTYKLVATSTNNKQSVESLIKINQ